MAETMRVSIIPRPAARTVASEAGFQIPSSCFLTRVPCVGEIITWEHKGVDFKVKQVSHHVGFRFDRDEPCATVVVG